jgi:hypothetical protein
MSVRAYINTKFAADRADVRVNPGTVLPFLVFNLDESGHTYLSIDTPAEARHLAAELLRGAQDLDAAQAVALKGAAS